MGLFCFSQIHPCQNTLILLSELTKTVNCERNLLCGQIQDLFFSNECRMQSFFRGFLSVRRHTLSSSKIIIHKSTRVYPGSITHGLSIQEPNYPVLYGVDAPCFTGYSNGNLLPSHPRLTFWAPLALVCIFIHSTLCFYNIVQFMQLFGYFDSYYSFWSCFL